jgi:DNA-binding phage protein
MALTRDFKETIVARVRRDPRFREALFTEAMNAYLSGDTAVGKAILRDLVNATIGFEGLGAEIQIPSKSLHRMLAPRGNPSTDNFFSIISALQRKTRVRLRIRSLVEEGRDARGIKTRSPTTELVARARKRSSMGKAESTRLAVQETRAHRRRR